jgi:hypothetical protein
MRQKLTVATKSNKHMRNGERGAALITVLLMSMLVLAASGALLLTTTMSATNSISATDEIQAYYAAEAGLQSALNVLRGNVAPHPNDGTKINFKNAINVGTSNNPSSGVAQLSRWLTYNYPSTNPDRVTLSPNYSTADGIAYSIFSITDPEQSDHVTYSTAGGFDGATPSSSPSPFLSIPSSGGAVTLTYTGAPSTDITTNGSPNLGSLKFTNVKPSTNINFTTTPHTFTLQVTESVPLPAGSSSPISVSIKGSFSGTITSTSSIVLLNFNNQTIEIPGTGTLFTMPSQTISIPADGTTTILQAAVSAPEPGRLVVKVHGYGPHGAVKNLQMMISRFGITYDPPATFVIRGAGNDSSTASTISIGSSANYVYSGLDNGGGNPLPAFLVTSDSDYTTLSTLKTNNPTGVQGDPSGLTPILSEVTLPANLATLPAWLQTTSDPVYGARAFVNQLRQAAQQTFVGCTSGNDPTCDRYFNVAAGDTAPTDLGATTTGGLFTFVDGDLSLSSGGGRGLLVVTGTLTMSGSQSFEGLVLVLGGGVLARSGGGNGTSLGAFVVAKFDSTGGFLSPTFTSSGSGTSTLQLDRTKVKTALRLGGLPVVSVSEF